MNLCSDGHEEVCFESRNCPMCELISNHKNEIDALETKIKSLEDDIEALNMEE